VDVAPALAGIREALECDGYGLEVVEVAQMLHLRVVALTDACEDCLVPAGVMAAMVSGALDGRWAPEQIEVELPDGGA
jgi:hypothetical protein